LKYYPVARQHSPDGPNNRSKKKKKKLITVCQIGVLIRGLILLSELEYQSLHPMTVSFFEVSKEASIASQRATVEKNRKDNFIRIVPKPIEGSLSIQVVLSA